MVTYGIGGEERKANNASEAISDIPLNRTLFVEKFTSDAAIQPDVIHDIKNIDDVFAYYKPETDIEFDREDGSSINEVLRFRNLAHFGKQGIVSQSPFLQNLNDEVSDLQKLIKQFKSNKILKTVLENQEAKENYLAALRALIQELDDAEKTTL